MPIIPFPTRATDPPLSALANAEAALTDPADNNTVEEVVLRLAGPVWSRLGYVEGRLWVPEADTGRLLRVTRWRAAGAGPADADDRAMLLKQREGLPGCAFEQSRVEWMGRHTLSDNRLRSEHRVCVPIRGGRTVTGVLELLSENQGEPAAGRLELLDQLGRRLGSFLQRMGV